MRYLIVICLIFYSCKRKPEFYINGKAYYTQTNCTESKTETIWSWHWGYNFFRGKWEWHYGPEFKTICLKEEWILLS